METHRFRIYCPPMPEVDQINLGVTAFLLAPQSGNLPAASRNKSACSRAVASSLEAKIAQKTIDDPLRLYDADQPPMARLLRH